MVQNFVHEPAATIASQATIRHRMGSMTASGQAVVLELLEEVRQLKLQVSQLQEQLRRTSHGTNSDHGSLFVQRRLTVAETCRLQQRPVFEFVRSAVLAYRAGQPAPSILPSDY